jgi:hypothetical protein
MRDKHLDRLKAIRKKIERNMRLAAGIGTGRAGIHSDKRERRVRHMGTKEWIEEAEEEMSIAEEVELEAYERSICDMELLAEWDGYGDR